jgi:hypothetical protein
MTGRPAFDQAAGSFPAGGRPLPSSWRTSERRMVPHGSSEDRCVGDEMPPTPTMTPTPTRTRTHRPTPTPSWTHRPTPTPTTRPATPGVCVAVQPSVSSIRPGQTASYGVWAAGLASNAAVVQIQAAQALGATGPRFTICPRARSTSCSVGSLPVNQADELAASVGVGTQAVGGERLVLTATCRRPASVPPRRNPRLTWSRRRPGTPAAS